MEILYTKDNIILTQDKAYVLAYEKQYKQSSANNEDKFEMLETMNRAEDIYTRIDENALEVDSASEKENETDEYSIWYTSNVKYSCTDLFDTNLISVDFTDYVESIRVLDFDINLEDVDLEKIEYIYVSKDTRNSQVSKRKKQLIIVIKNEDDEDEKISFDY